MERRFDFMEAFIDQKKSCHIGGDAITECVRASG